MDFWEFFLAVLAGKAGVKATMQCLFFCAIFSDEYVEIGLNWMSRTISGLCTYNGGRPCHVIAKEMLEKNRLKFSDPEAAAKAAAASGGEPWIKVLFGWFVICVMAWFLITSIEQFAQIYAKEVDDKEIEKAKQAE